MPDTSPASRELRIVMLVQLQPRTTYFMKFLSAETAKSDEY